MMGGERPLVAMKVVPKCAGDLIVGDIGLGLSKKLSGALILLELVPGTVGIIDFRFPGNSVISRRVCGFAPSLEC